MAGFSKWSLSPFLDKNSKKVSREAYLFSVGCFASLGAVVQGYTATFLGLISTDEHFLSFLNTSTDEPIYEVSATKFVTPFYIGLFIGALCSYPFSDAFGRRSILVVAAGCGAIFCLWSVLAYSPADLYSSLLFFGWTVGTIVSIAPCYVAEISVAAERGKLVGFTAMGLSIGSFLATLCFLVLRYISVGWRLGLFIGSFFLGSLAVLMWYVPESHRWLLAHRTPAECLEAMRQFRRTNNVSVEFNEIYKALITDAKLGDGWIDILGNSSISYRLLLSCLLQGLQQLVGIQVLAALGSSVLDSLGVHSADLGLTLAFVSGIVGCAYGLYKVDHWGRRLLALMSCGCVAVSWMAASLCVSTGGLEHGKGELYIKSYLLRFFFGSFLCLFAFSYSMGIGIVDWIVPSELFPLRARAKAASLSTATRYAAALLASYLLEDAIKSEVPTVRVLLGFAVGAITLGLVIFIMLPETTGLSMFDDVEDLFDVSGLYCCCCLDGKAGLLGFRNSKHTVIGGGLATSVDRAYSATGLDTSSSSPFYDPAQLHKYSSEMRALAFQYMQDEEEPLVWQSTRPVNSKLSLLPCEINVSGKR